jgi:LacI family transcriptional regulator
LAKKRVTLADVARHAGLSSTAVSLILNGRPDTRLSADAVARARASATELGYRPNLAAQTLSTRRSRTIGFLSDTIASSRFAGPLILGALREARARGHVLLIAETEGSIDAETEAAEALADRQVDAVIIAGVRPHEVEIPEALRGIRHVMLNMTSTTPAPHVLPDEYVAGHAVTQRLLDAGHHDGIVMVGTTLTSRNDPTTTAVRRRLTGIHDALATTGATLRAEIGYEPWEPEMGYESVTQLLNEHDGVTALLCLNDRAAIGAYHACLDHGLHIPKTSPSSASTVTKRPWPSNPPSSPPPCRTRRWGAGP